MPLTSDRDTPRKDGTINVYGLAASTTIYAGAMVALNSDGYAVPASDTEGLRVAGRAEESIVNDGADGDASIRCCRGVFGYEVSETNAPTAADVGHVVFVEDDETVSTDGGTNRIPAGVLTELSDDQAFILIMPHGTRVAAAQDDSVATDVLGVVDDINALLAKLKASGLMASA